MVAEFEAGLTRARRRDGIKAATAKRRLRGKQPKLSPMQEAHLVGCTAPASTPSANSKSSSASPGSTAYRAVRRAANGATGPRGRSREAQTPPQASSPSPGS
jgi:hypothetical protein